MKQRVIELIKYGFFGGITTLINLGLFAWLDSLNIMHYVIANGLAYAVAVVINYVCNKFFVFNSENGSVPDKKENAVQFLKFIALRVVSLAVDSLLFFVLVELLEDAVTVNLGFITTRLIIRVLLSMVIIMATYVINKLFIFGSKTEKDEKSEEK